MSTPTAVGKTIALAGNPNTGKSSLFNALTGMNSKVGNYPGITVDRRVGQLKLDGTSFQIVDIPGIYSLNARSKEEELALRVLLGQLDQKPDLVVLVLDATLLERNLYLALQLQELGLPLMLAVNMMDAANNQGIAIDLPALSEALALPVVGISATSSQGVDPLKLALSAHFSTAKSGNEKRPKALRRWAPSSELQRLLDDTLPIIAPSPAGINSEGWALWALMSADSEGQLSLLDDTKRSSILQLREACRGRGLDMDAEVSSARYACIDALADKVIQHPPEQITWTDRLDAIFTHPILGFGVFIALMMMVFSSLFSWADPAIGLVEDSFAFIGDTVASALGPGLVTDFLVNGLIAGVGSVLVFLPQILLLFFFIVLMESSGYMARAAFLMDRIMNSIGLHGRAFVPMLSGYACAIPAILATRTMERERDRLLTMMVIPLMSCSARLPVYTLVIAALFPPNESWGPIPVAAFLLTAMYLFSTALALIAAAVIGRTVLKGKRVPLILELPPYRMPSPKTVARTLFERSKVFVTEAGTVILLCTILLWGLLTFPQAPSIADNAPPELVMHVQSEALANSYGGQMGRAIEPILEPLGFDWKIGVGLIGAFAAREVFVSTMGVIYGVGADVDEGSVSLRDKLSQETKADGTPQFSPLTGLSLMVFIALACQCMSTLAVLKRETGGYKWPTFVFAYMTILAYVCSLAVYQGGLLLGFS